MQPYSRRRGMGMGGLTRSHTRADLDRSDSDIIISGSYWGSGGVGHHRIAAPSLVEPQFDGGGPMVTRLLSTNLLYHGR